MTPKQKLKKLQEKEQFIEAIINEGYKVIDNSEYGILLRKRYKKITIQEWEDYNNVFYENYNSRDFSFEYNQHRVTDYAKALKNIKSFERMLKR